VNQFVQLNNLNLGTDMAININGEITELILPEPFDSNFDG
jgi:hypothetical protein